VALGDPVVYLFGSRAERVADFFDEVEVGARSSVAEGVVDSGAGDTGGVFVGAGCKALFSDALGDGGIGGVADRFPKRSQVVG